MDDRTKGVGGERMGGRGDDFATGPEEPAVRRPKDSAADRMNERMTGRVREAARGYAATPEGEQSLDQRTDEIRAEVEQTREQMSETIDEIQDRLRPRNIVANAASSVRDAAGDAMENARGAASQAIEQVTDSRAVHHVQANPIPTAMVGVGLVGLAWLVLGGRDSRSRARRQGFANRFEDERVGRRYDGRDDYYRGTAAVRPEYESAAAYTPGPSYGEGQPGRVRDLASKTGEYARQAGWKARQQTRRAQTQLQRAITQNPLLVGAAAAALGVAIGLAIPETEQENEWMGETRDNLVEGAQQKAREAANRVQQAATDAATQVQNAAGEVIGLVSKDEESK
jgi:hypothetical protein